MTNWRVKERKNKNSLIESLFADRGIDTEEKRQTFLFPDYEKNLNDPFLFPQMPAAVERIKKARDKKEKTAIFGDYDADGITSSIILKETLTLLGIETVVYIPDKKKEGYGMNMAAVQELASRGVKLIVTVDCGITGWEETEKARELGIDVIITDHHNVPDKLPDAVAIINPKIKNSGYPFKDLAGVGVAFKLAQAIYQTFFPEKKEQLKWALDLAAIGTVADCVPLLGENRTIVKFGLIVLSKTRRTGLKELFSVGRMQIDENNAPDAWNISFQIAPRINAAGRMDHANAAFYLLCENDTVKCRELALELEGKNSERQKITNQIVDEIRIQAKSIFKGKRYIAAAGEHYPIGVIGLAAGKIAQEFNRPTVILQKGEKESRGSLRSVPQANIMEILKGCRDLLIKFGGHAQAAGMEIKNENLALFFERFGKLSEEALRDVPDEPDILIDAEVLPEEINFDLAQGISQMEPFGEGNREPVFLMRGLEINEMKYVGNGEKHIKLFLRPQNGSPKIFEAIGFGMAKQFENISAGGVLDVVFTLSEDSWNGNKKLVLKLVDAKFSGGLRGNK